MLANNETGVDPAGRRAGRVAHARRRARSTPTPCRRSARLPVDVRGAGRGPAVADRPTSSAVPRAPARSGSAAGSRWPAVLTGGRQERNRRRGHRERPGASWGSAWRPPRRAGRAAAARRACGALRDRLEQRRSWPRSRDARSTAAAPTACPNTTNISFEGVEAESLLIALDLEGHRGLDRVGLLVGHARALARAARDGPAARAACRARSASASGADDDGRGDRPGARGAAAGGRCASGVAASAECGELQSKTSPADEPTA